MLANCCERPRDKAETDCIDLYPQANEDSDCRQGHKWTLASLWQYFAESGIDSAPVIESIKDLVIKTIISAESSMYTVRNMT